MSDINRNSSDGELIRSDNKLRSMHLQIIISEKLNQLKALDVHIDKLRTVDLKQMELKKATLQKEVVELQKELNNPQIIEVKPNK